MNRFFSTALILCLCAALRADTVILKSGDKLEGKILGETDTEVTMSVQVTATIKDERVIKRDTIEKIEKVQPDEEAWAQIANFAPGSESLERDEYDRVKAALSYFTGTFPKSAHAQIAQSRLDQFSTEQIRVGMGEVKLNNQWLGKEKVREEQIQIGGRILLNRMKRAAAAGQFPDAMANLDQLEKNFLGSASYPEAVDLGRRVLPSLKAAVEQRQAQLKRRADDEKQRLTTSKGVEHDQLEALIKKETASTEATITAIERSGVKWLPLQPANARSMTALASRVSSETSRLNGLPVEKMRESVKAAEEAEKALSTGNFDGAEKALRDATSAWSANELAKRLQTRLTDAKKAASAVKPREPTPAPAQTPKPKPKAAPSSANNPAPATAEPEETPFFKKPVFFIGLAAVVAFGAVAGKMIAKARASAADTTLDK
ncbi:MAG: PTPDL family protein [Chthoniobacteraceae bacterium]